LSPYAAFNTKTGEVLGKTAARHTSAEFVAFLADIVVNQPRGKEIHVIADELPSIRYFHYLVTVMPRCFCQRRQSPRFRQTRHSGATRTS
jgi:hypothetical protein